MQLRFLSTPLDGALDHLIRLCRDAFDGLALALLVEGLSQSVLLG